MTFEDCVKIIGLPVNAPEVVDFIANNGYKYPKKDTISNRGSDRKYWIENKKLKANFVCRAEIHNIKYKPIPGDKKGVFYPLVFEFQIRDAKTIIDLPMGINLSMSFEEIKKILGEPNEHIDDSYDWDIQLEDYPDLIFMIFYWKDKKIFSEMNLRIKSEIVLFELFDTLSYQNFEIYRKNINNRDVATQYFVKWLIEKDYLLVTETNRKVLEAIKNDELSVLEYLKQFDKGYIGLDEVVQHNQPIYNYFHNFNKYHKYYYDDYVKLFLTDKKLLKNYLGDEAQKFLNTIAFNNENYQTVKKHLDRIDFNKIISF